MRLSITANGVLGSFVIDQIPISYATIMVLISRASTVVSISCDSTGLFTRHTYPEVFLPLSFMDHL